MKRTASTPIRSITAACGIALALTGCQFGGQTSAGSSTQPTSAAAATSAASPASATDTAAATPAQPTTTDASDSSSIDMSTPSAAAYCAVMNKYKKRYLDQFSAANSNVDQTSDAGQFLGGMLQALMAMSELPSMFRDMATVAPPEIKSNTDRVATAYEKQWGNAADDPMNPGTALVKNLAIGLTVMGPMQNVDQYVKDHCS